MAYKLGDFKKLTFVLDTIDGDTNIILTLNGDIVGKAKLYDFPDRHDLNIYYGHKVVLVKAISEDNMWIVLEGEQL